MKVNEIIANALSKPETTVDLDKIVRVSFDSVSLNYSLARMSNEEKVELIKGVLGLFKIADSDQKAREQLMSLYGSKIQSSPALNARRFMYSLSHSGQFRCWHQPFGRVYSSHFDSVGHGLIFTSWCKNYGVLMEFVDQLTGQMIKWVSDAGTIWVGDL